MWNTLFFQKTTLRELGLQIQLGHGPGHVCPTKEAGHKNFVVIDSNGIHEVHIDFCQCCSVPRHQQLLCIGWWPSTSPLEPQTCATMDVLCHFDLLNLQGKLPPYSFYRTLELQTDNTGISPPPVGSLRYRVEWYFDLTLSAGSHGAIYVDDTGVEAH